MFQTTNKQVSFFLLSGTWKSLLDCALPETINSHASLAAFQANSKRQNATWAEPYFLTQI